MPFVSIRTSTIRPASPLLFDVFVHFREQYLKYKGTNDSFDKALLDRFKEKKVKKLFIPAEQEPSYLKYLDAALGDLQAKEAPVAARAELAQEALRQEADNIDKTLESAEAYQSSQDRVLKVVDFMLSEPKALAGMLSSAGLSVDDSAHGSTVSSLCLAVGALSKLVSKEELADLAVAGLLHDIGLKELGFDAKSSLADVPKEKRADFRKHPAVAVERVAGKKFITPRVLRILEDHEEYGPGLGFPNKKNYAKLAPDSRIFNLCDAFDHFSIRAGKEPALCLDDFISERGEHFDMDLLGILEKAIKA